MTSRSDIIDNTEVYRANGSIRDRGLIYTTECGWVDLGHANPEGKGFQGANNLWRQIRSQTVYLRCVPDNRPTKVVYEQSMRKFGMKAGIAKRYAVRKELNSEDEQKSIALAIFMDVSLAFESLQQNWFFRHVTNSGYSAEDLVSNLISFYRAVNPNVDYIKICNPVSKKQSLAIWDTYGAVGDTKNSKPEPILYPNPLIECGVARRGRLPWQLDTIKPAVIGNRFWELK